MLAESLQRLGADVLVYDPDPDAPALRRAARAITGPWTDVARLDAFFSECDVVTYEFENVETAGLGQLALKGRLRPSLAVLETAQDRIREKEFFRVHGLPHAEFRASRLVDDLVIAGRDLGLPAILKTARGGYDGKGQWKVATLDDLARLAGGPEAEVLARTGWVLEERIGIEREVSCVVARDESGVEAVFPLFENEHAEHILDTTVVPARVPEEVAREAREIAGRAATALGVVGLLTTELFLGTSERTAGGPRLFVNELAPRPHNSGHVTRQACRMSQFDALARVLLGVPLGPTELLPGAFCMANLLGDVWLAQGREELDLSAWSDFPDVLDVVLYGKREARQGRKMGHLVTAAPDAETAVARARAFRERLRQGVSTR